MDYTVIKGFERSNLKSHLSARRVEKFLNRNWPIFLVILLGMVAFTYQNVKALETLQTRPITVLHITR